MDGLISWMASDERHLNRLKIPASSDAVLAVETHNKAQFVLTPATAGDNHQESAFL